MACAEPWATSCPLGENRGGTPEGVRALQGARCTERCRTCKLAPTGVLPPFFLYLFLLLQWRREEKQSPLIDAEAIFGGRTFRTRSARTKTRRGNEIAFSPFPARGERSSEARVRGPLRDSERCGSSVGVADSAANLSPAERPPHPDLLLRLRAQRFGGLQPAEARRASEGGPHAGRRRSTRRSPRALSRSAGADKAAPRRTKCAGCGRGRPCYNFAVTGEELGYA